MANPAKILVAEDEAITRLMIVRLLQHAGYLVVEAQDGITALRLSGERPALCIMDVNMPEMGGFGVVQEMRQRGNDLPVLMLSAQGEIDDRVKGLGLGADDYMAKPFDPRELLARVAALLRRRPGTHVAVRLLQRADLVIDLAAKRANRGGESLPLTATEFAILEVLAREMGHPVSRERMLEAVWGYTFASNTKTVETHIWRLRKKLGDASDQTGWIQNRQGLGYLLAPEVAAEAVLAGR